jgi:hypothetical protein
MYGAILLCEAENWCIPERLPPDLHKLLDTTDIPFGQVIAPLRPARRTIAVDFHWPSANTERQSKYSHNINASEDLQSCPARLFEHRAVVLINARQPVAAVIERYRVELIAFALQGARQLE